MGEREQTGTTTAPKGFRPEPFAYHEVVELEITTLTNQGQGLARLANWVIFVPFALPGEIVRARIYKNHSNHSEADLVEVLQASPHRIAPPCELFTRCGGCQYQNFEYSEQLSWKKRQVEELLLHMAKIETPVNEVIPSPARYAYRSKITPHFQKPRSGEIGPIGFLQAGRRQRVLDVPQCPIASSSINAALTPLRERVRSKASSYRRGATLLLRDSNGGVLTDPNAVAEESIGDLTLRFGAGDFFQNNPHILPAFTGYVGSEAAAHGARTLVDAYCGSGLFCLTAAHLFDTAIGIEINENSVRWARENAAANAVPNATFQCGAADSIFEGIEALPDDCAVIIDPPRKGCDAVFLEQLLAFAPRNVVYVSCNPATQMRDLTTLTAAGAYTISAVQPFDLFPQTKHLECVISLKLCTISKTPPTAARTPRARDRRGAREETSS